MLDDATVEIVFVGAEHLTVVERIRAELPTVKRLIATSGSNGIAEPYAAWRDQQPGADPAIEGAADDPVLHLRRSGAGGQSGLMTLTHEALLTCLVSAAQGWCPCSAADVFLTCTPPFQGAAACWGLLPLLVGAPLVIAGRADPAEILKLIPTEHVTHAFFAPDLLRWLLQAAGSQETDWSSLRLVASGGAPIPPDLVRRAADLFGSGVVQARDLAEVGDEVAMTTS